jgi:hypothetical protein
MNVKLALLALVVIAIDPLDAEPPAHSKVSLVFSSYSSQPDAIGVGDGGQIRVSAAWVAMQDVQIRPASACKRASAKPVVDGKLTTELVSRTTVEGLAIEATRYCVFELQLRRSRGRTAGAPSELRGASIVITGRRADGVPFLLRSRVESEIVLRARELEGISVTGPRTRWIVGIDLARWMAGVDLALADTTNDRRELRIDENSNSELLATFEANVAEAFALFEDLDGDRDLDPSERAMPIAIRR